MMLVETTSSLCVLLEINMSNNRNVSKYRGSVEEILPENAISVFLETNYPKRQPRADFPHYRIMTIDCLGR